MTSICLCMIVKDEAPIVEATLVNILKHVKLTDWVICDTGSSDATVKIITKFFKKNKIFGRIVNHKWKNFGHNRTLSMNAARLHSDSDYIFVFDADDSIVGDSFKLDKDTVMDADGYKVTFGGPGRSQYQRLAFFSNQKGKKDYGLRWKYIGVLHEVATAYYVSHASNRNPVMKQLPFEDYYFVSGRTGNRNKNQVTKYEKDVACLEEAVIEYNVPGTKDPDNIKGRCTFYLAQSYECLAQALVASKGDKDLIEKHYDSAIATYKIVADKKSPGWIQEKYVSCMRIFELYRARPGGSIDARALPFLFSSLTMDTERMETLSYLAEYFFTRKPQDHKTIHSLFDRAKHLLISEDGDGKLRTPPFREGKLFENTSAHFYLIHAVSVSSYHVNDLETGLKCCEYTISKNNGGCPGGPASFMVNNAVGNQKIYKSKIEVLTPAVVSHERKSIALLIASTSRGCDWKSIDDCPLINTLLKPLVEGGVKPGDGIKVFLSVDNGDEFYDNPTRFEEIKARFGVAVDDIFMVSSPNPDKSPVHAWNVAFNAAVTYPGEKIDTFFQIGDDVQLLTPKETLIEMATLSKPGYMVFPVDGTYMKGRPNLATQSMVTRDHHEKFGFYFPPEIKNWFCDDWISEVYLKAGRCLRTSSVALRSTFAKPRYKVEHVARARLNELVSDGVEKLLSSSSVVVAPSKIDKKTFDPIRDIITMFVYGSKDVNTPDGKMFLVWLKCAKEAIRRTGGEIHIFTTPDGVHSSIIDVISKTENVFLDVVSIDSMKPPSTGPNRSWLHLFFKLHIISEYKKPFMWLDVDAIFADSSEIETMMAASTTKPLILVDHQTIPRHTAHIPFKFPNMGVMYVSDPDFLDYETLKKTVTTRKCPGGLDQELIWNYCLSIGYDYTHPDVSHGWNACGGYKKRENGKLVSTGIPEVHDVYILHYWDEFKPWNKKCFVYDELLLSLTERPTTVSKKFHVDSGIITALKQNHRPAYKKLGENLENGAAVPFYDIPMFNPSDTKSLEIFENAYVTSNGCVFDSVTGKNCYINGVGTGVNNGDASGYPKYDKVVTFSGQWATSIFHFPMETIVAIRAVCEDTDLSDYHLHVDSLTPYMKQWMEVVKFPIPLERVVIGPISANILLVPEPGKCGNPNKEQVDWLRDRILESLDNDSTPPRDHVVLIKRNGVREVKNFLELENSVRNFCEKSCLTLFVHDDSCMISVSEQLRYFKRAAVVVGPHGAGNTNIIACSPGTIFVEFLESNRNVNICYARLASILGLKYTGISFSPSFSVDTRMVEEAIVDI